MTDEMTDRERYGLDRRKRFLRIGPEDVERATALKEFAEATLDRLLAPLYEHFLDTSETREFFQSPRHVEGVKAAQRRFFRQLTDGEYEDDYLSSRLRVGRTHERIGLKPEWYLGAYGNYLTLLLDSLAAHFKGDPDALVASTQSIIKLVFLDMGLAIETYNEAQQGRTEALQTQFEEAVRSFSAKLQESTAGISTTIAQQGASANEQATSVAEVTTTIAELRQTSRQAIDAAEEVTRAAADSVEVSRQGAAAVEHATLGMQEIQQQMETIADRILNLSEQTQQIGEIIQSVNEIAEQSKLLALNAAIEAARAGEHGRGFAVVAAEIRSLAEQSKESTAQVRSILGQIQKATNAAVIATEAGNKRVEDGVKAVHQAGTNLHSLSGVINQSAEAGRMISIAARQQTAGTEQVASAMAEINAVTQSNLEALRGLQRASQNLLALGDEMAEMLAEDDDSGERVIDWRYA
jgi:methyl-accepting chemotaxis protein